MYDYTELNKLTLALAILGYDVEPKTCNDGLKVESKSEGWDFAINSCTYGHDEGLLESYGIGDECVGYLTAKKALQMVLSL